MLTTKSVQFDFKRLTEKGEFEGLLSPFNNVDAGGDLVEPTAFTKNLREQGFKRPLLWQHQTDVPIGQLTLEERAEGLWAKGKLLLDLPEAQRAYKLIKSDIVSGLSIGFQSVRDQFVNGVRHLKEIKLFEGSIVTFPMNELAVIQSVKAAQHLDAKRLRTTLENFQRDITRAIRGY